MTKDQALAQLLKHHQECICWAIKEQFEAYRLSVLCIEDYYTSASGQAGRETPKSFEGMLGDIYGDMVTAVRTGQVPEGV